MYEALEEAVAQSALEKKQELGKYIQQEQQQVKRFLTHLMIVYGYVAFEKKPMASQEAKVQIKKMKIETKGQYAKSAWFQDIGAIVYQTVLLSEI